MSLLSDVSNHLNIVRIITEYTGLEDDASLAFCAAAEVSVPDTAAITLEESLVQGNTTLQRGSQLTLLFCQKIPSQEEARNLLHCLSHGASCKKSAEFTAVFNSCVRSHYDSGIPSSKWLTCDAIVRAFVRIINDKPIEAATRLFSNREMVNALVPSSDYCDALYTIFAYAVEQGRVDILEAGLNSEGTLPLVSNSYDFKTRIIEIFGYASPDRREATKAAICESRAFASQFQWVQENISKNMGS